MEVGFIGLGTMGLPMVANLARAGHRLTVHDSRQGAVDAAAGLDGVTPKADAGEVAKRSEVLFTCLPNDEIVRQVYLGPGGVAEGANPGLITCDTSTVSPQVSIEIQARLAGRKIRHLDTPMLGSQPQAVEGSLFYIVAGDADAAEKVAPLLAAMGKMQVYAGPSGSANRVKLIHNSLAAVTAVAVAESLALCIRSGVEPELFYRIVCEGGGMAYSTYFDRRAARVAAGEFSPTFALELMLKDVTLARKLADEAEIPAPMMEEARKTYAEGLAGGWGKEDFSAVSHVIEARMGAKLFGGG